MSQIRFQVVPPIDRPESPVFITGSHPGLGAWKPDCALKLDWKPPFHVGEIESDTGHHFDYKITRGNWETEAVDAYGHVPGNFCHEVWLDATRHHTVADWKDRYSGRLTHERIHSPILAGTRDLLIWLPPSYGSDSLHRFPILILHDGDNVFDPATSAISGVDWAADEWIKVLSRRGALPETIVVGVCHPEGFSDDNASLRDFDLSPELSGSAYAHFIVDELVPHMDAHYRTIPKPTARVLGGASLGALNAFHVSLNHPGVFGGFVCLSTSFEDVSHSVPDRSALLLALAEKSSLDPATRMYFDYGDQGLDECYEGYHKILGSLFREKGWIDGEQFLIQRIAGGSHSEISWRNRLGDALVFLSR